MKVVESCGRENVSDVFVNLDVQTQDVNEPVESNLPNNSLATQHKQISQMEEISLKFKKKRCSGASITSAR